MAVDKNQRFYSLVYRMRVLENFFKSVIWVCGGDDDDARGERENPSGCEGCWVTKFNEIMWKYVHEVY